MKSLIKDSISKIGSKINKWLSIKYVYSFDCKVCYGDLKIWATCFDGCCGENKPSSPVLSLCNNNRTENQRMDELKGNMKIWFQANHNVWHYHKDLRTEVCNYLRLLEGLKKFNVNHLGVIYVEGNVDLVAVQDTLQRLLGTPVILLELQMEGNMENKPKEEETCIEQENGGVHYERGECSGTKEDIKEEKSDRDGTECDDVPHRPYYDPYLRCYNLDGWPIV